MNVLVAGATGFIGSRLVAGLLERGHGVSAISRDPLRAATLLGPRVRVVASARELEDAPVEAVINLAGQPLPGRRWSPAYKQLLRDSRIAFTGRLLSDLQQAGQCPALWLNASAIGYYGDTGARNVGESDPPGEDFAATLCRDWEAAAARARDLFGARVGCVRIGLVLGPGGALKSMLPPFRLGLGGPIGSGLQQMSWIHRDDLVALFIWLLEQPGDEGAWNGTAPRPVSNSAFANALGRALGRPARLPMPAPLLRLALGEMAGLLLTGQRVLPLRALEGGFRFRFDRLEDALAEVLAEVLAAGG